MELALSSDHEKQAPVSWLTLIVLWRQEILELRTDSGLFVGSRWCSYCLWTLCDCYAPPLVTKTPEHTPRARLEAILNRWFMISSWLKSKKYNTWESWRLSWSVKKLWKWWVDVKVCRKRVILLSVMVIFPKYCVSSFTIIYCTIRPSKYRSALMVFLISSLRFVDPPVLVVWIALNARFIKRNAVCNLAAWVWSFCVIISYIVMLHPSWHWKQPYDCPWGGKNIFGRLQFMQQLRGQSDIVCCYSGLK